MSDLSNTTLSGILIGLVLLSAFFAGSETGMMSLNRYRLRHQARVNKRARRVLQLVERPDRLLGVILIANNFTNILASAIATILTVRIFGDEGVLPATLSLTLMVLIFAEITPKTLAAMSPEAIAFPASLPLKWLLTFLYPLVWITNMISGGILRLFGYSAGAKNDALSLEELKSLVYEGGHHLPSQHRSMLLSILELENNHVSSIMVHRTNIVGIDLNRPWSEIITLLSLSPHTVLPVYRNDIDNVLGLLHLRVALYLLSKKQLNEKTLIANLEKPYFIPSHTSLNTQLLYFQTEKRRMALVVNEYGDIIGLIALSDLLEEIVGEFKPHILSQQHSIMEGSDNSYTLEGTLLVRDLNRHLGWNVPNFGARTLSGAIIAYLETIPEPGTCLNLGEYSVEVLVVKDNRVKEAKIFKPML